MTNYEKHFFLNKNTVWFEAHNFSVKKKKSQAAQDWSSLDWTSGAQARRTDLAIRQLTKPSWHRVNLGLTWGPTGSGALGQLATLP